MPEAAEKPLWERVGGDEALQAVTKSFYDKVLADESLKKFFDETKMDKQIEMFAKFLAYAFGKPNAEWNGRSMKAAHAGARKKGLNEDTWNAVMGHMGKTLGEFKVPEKEINEIVAIANSVKDDVIKD